MEREYLPSSVVGVVNADHRRPVRDARSRRQHRHGVLRRHHPAVDVEDSSLRFNVFSRGLPRRPHAHRCNPCRAPGHHATAGEDVLPGLTASYRKRSRTPWPQTFHTRRLANCGGFAKFARPRELRMEYLPLDREREKVSSHIEHLPPICIFTIYLEACPSIMSTHVAANALQAGSFDGSWPKAVVHSEMLP